jgi:hypothetical protein
MSDPRPSRTRLAALAAVPAAAVISALFLVLAPLPAAAAGSASLPGAIVPMASASASAPSSPSTTPARPNTTRAPVIHTVGLHLYRTSVTPRPHPKRKPWPVSVVLRTTPALAAVRFSVDGAIYATGADGTVTVTRAHDFTPHTLALLTPAFSAAGHRYAFARWSGQRDPDQTYRTVVTGLPWRAGYAITAAFTEQCPVKASFTDQHGAPIDPASLTSATLRSDTGELSPLPVRGAAWLACTTAVYSGGTLSIRPLTYRLQSLLTAGTNVVDAGRQSFKPASEPAPVFAGYYYDLSVTAHDALFRGGSGSAALVTGSDGVQHRLAFPASHLAVFQHLPRGDYTVDITGGGLGLSKTLRLSRETNIDLDVVTGGDMGAGAAGGAAFALSFPLLARHRYDWSRRVRRRREVAPE